MKILKIMMCMTATVLLFGLTGCGGAPGASDSDVKKLVKEIFQERIDTSGQSRFRLELNNIRTISIDKSVRKTTAQAEVTFHCAGYPSVTYDTTYTAQYTENDDLYVTVLSTK